MVKPVKRETKKPYSKPSLTAYGRFGNLRRREGRMASRIKWEVAHRRTHTFE